MASLEGFDASQVEPHTGFDPVPDGDYLAMIVDSEFKPTKAGDGEYLQLTEEIIEGPHRGRRLFDRLNLKNKNDTARKIAEGTLSAICRAVGVLRPRDSSELHGKPMLISVGVEENKDKPGNYNNKVKKYLPANGAVPAAAPAQASASAASSTPPWKRKAG